jgi:hypothetical protein
MKAAECATQNEAMKGMAESKSGSIFSNFNARSEFRDQFDLRDINDIATGSE